MNNRRFFKVSTIIIFAMGLSFAQYEADFQKGFPLKLKDGTTFKGLNGFCAPEVTDWNDDGKKDLLVGVKGDANAKIHLLINSGTDKAPEFEEAPFLKDKNGNDVIGSYG